MVEGVMLGLVCPQCEHEIKKELRRLTLEFEHRCARCGFVHYIHADEIRTAVERLTRALERAGARPA